MFNISSRDRNILTLPERKEKHIRENNNYTVRGMFLIMEYVLVGLFQLGFYLMFYFSIKTRLLLQGVDNTIIHMYSI
jgi:hypothetical protein